MPNFVKIDQSVAQELRFKFFKMMAIHHLEFVWGEFRLPT